MIDLLDDLGEELGVRRISLDRLAPLDLAAGRERVAGDDRDLAPGIAELRGNRRAEEAGPAEDTVRVREGPCSQSADEARKRQGFGTAAGEERVQLGRDQL